MDEEFLNSIMKKPDVSFAEVFIPINILKRIKESIIFPLNSKIKEPNENTGHVLLYGEPGTGKTHLTNAVTTELSHVTCLSLSFYELKSDGVLRNLFNQARLRKPAIIFLDDVEVFSVAKTEEGKKLTSEFLSQLQGSEYNNGEGVIVVGMTNKPWKLDPTILNCFPIRIEIPLPNDKERLDILKYQLKGTDISLSDKELLEIVKQTQGFTGADIVCLVRDALMEPVRIIQKTTHYLKVKETSGDQQVAEDKWAPCSPETPGAVPMTWSELKEDQLVVPKLSMGHFLKSFSTTRPSTDDEYHSAIAKFTKEHGN